MVVLVVEGYQTAWRSSTQTECKECNPNRQEGHPDLGHES